MRPVRWLHNMEAFKKFVDHPDHGADLGTVDADRDLDCHQSITSCSLGGK